MANNYIDLPANGAGGLPTELDVKSRGWSNISVSKRVEVINISTQLLGLNISRIYAHIINNGTQLVYIQYGSSAVYGQCMRLNAGGVLVLSGFELYLGSINAISTTSIMIDVLEGE